MKKIISLLLLILSLILTSCGASNSSSDYTPHTPPPNQNAVNDAQKSENYNFIGEVDGSESYLTIDENTNLSTNSDSVITFSLKVDTASYRNAVRYIESGNLPPKDAVRIEEMINYFTYDEKMLQSDDPFSIYSEIGRSPFDANKYLAFVRVRSKDVDVESLPKSNLTFLIDTSGSMSSYDKLPLLKDSFELLVDTLTEDDMVSIVTYAGSSEVLLDSVSGADREKILNAIYNLDAGGSTAGADGINTAYKLAEKNFKDGGNNRIILASDGDFNVGISSLDGLERLVKEKKDNGIYLSILGFGTGNVRDDVMETLAKYGNGNYSYIDSIRSAEKVLVDEAKANLFTIADDVKAQVEFNPNEVASYRLIGYENRRMDNKDFNDDTKDAGEIGIGTDVVLMFEVELKSNPDSVSLKYSNTTVEPDTNEDEFEGELFEVRIRYKDPGNSESKLILYPVRNDKIRDTNTSDFTFAKSVAAFGHLLRNSEYSGNININDIISFADDSRGRDEKGYRQEFIGVLKLYRNITR